MLFYVDVNVVIVSNVFLYSNGNKNYFDFILFLHKYHSLLHYAVTKHLDLGNEIATKLSLFLQVNGVTVSIQDLQIQPPL